MQLGPVAAGERHTGDLVVPVGDPDPHLVQPPQVLHAVRRGRVQLVLPEVGLEMVNSIFRTNELPMNNESWPYPMPHLVFRQRGSQLGHLARAQPGLHLVPHGPVVTTRLVREVMYV